MEDSVADLETLVYIYAFYLLQINLGERKTDNKNDEKCINVSALEVNIYEHTAEIFIAYLFLLLIAIQKGTNDVEHTIVAHLLLEDAALPCLQFLSLMHIE